MADKQTTTYELRFNMIFADTDTRTLTIKNPKSGITTQAVEELQTLIRNGENGTLLVSDKTGAAFLNFTSVERVETTRTELDITQ